MVATVGIVGSGQLARMTYQAGISLGVPVRVLADRPDEAAAAVAADLSFGRADRAEDLAVFARTCDVLTFDHELVDLEALEGLERSGVAVRPGAATLVCAVDKAVARRRFSASGLPVPAFAEVDDPADVEAFAERTGWPVVLKAARGGYDGRGVWVVAGRTEARTVVEDARRVGLRLLVEAHVPISRELAVMVARRPAGEAVVYPVVETVQADGMCREVRRHRDLSDEVADAAGALGLQVAKELDATGVLAVELFDTPGGLVVNEIAARPHNSGHWTIEGAVTSQFENHLRAVLDLPLGLTDPLAPAVVMVNVIGPAAGVDPSAGLARALAVPGAHIHLYAKTARPGRKLGHVTVLGDDPEEAAERAWAAATALVGAP